VQGRNRNFECLQTNAEIILLASKEIGLEINRHETKCIVRSSARRYPYFDVVVGFAWLNDPESYAGYSIATGRASHARQVEGDDPDEKGYPGPPGWGLGVGLTTSPHKKCLVEKLSKLETRWKQQRRPSTNKDF
jgi:hypothetical protein